jgi:hypothetical protein
MVATHSKSHGFPQEAALALRTYILAMQSSHDRKSKIMNMRDLVNRMVAEHGGGNFHRK